MMWKVIREFIFYVCILSIAITQIVIGVKMHQLAQSISNMDRIQELQHELLQEQQEKQRLREKFEWKGGEMSPELVPAPSQDRLKSSL